MKTQTLKLTAIFLILAGGLASCKEKEKPFLTVDETSIAIAGEAGSHSIVVNSNNDWTAVVENAESTDWCTLDNSTGNGNGTITINIAKNLLPIARNATVKITSGNSTISVSINQEAAEYPIEIPFTKYSLSDSCQWKNLYQNKIIVINNEEQESYISCTDENYLGIDFSKWTLLVILTDCGIHSNVTRMLLKQSSDNQYLLSVNIIPSIDTDHRLLIISILIPKIDESIQIELDLNVTTF